MDRIGGVVVVASVVALFFVVLACSVWRRLAMRGLALVRRDDAGLLRIELRRHSGMQTHADGRGGRSYPEPVETRHLTWLLCEVPVWSRVESIGLPSQCEDRIEKVGADEFDRHFTPQFQRRRGLSESSQAATA